ncbi:MAG TPA: hypothetical protein VLA25_03230, partial [Methylotenera sp.]|nr:hypothetical protein [Methylotenera sp.]
MQDNVLLERLMKKWMLAVSLVATGLLANIGYAEEIPSTQDIEEAQLQPLVTEIPTEEKAFVEVINQFNKAKI